MALGKRKVKMFRCSCGKAKCFCIACPVNGFDDADHYRFAKLRAAGFKSKNITLTAAKRMQLCFGCQPLSLNM